HPGVIGSANVVDALGVAIAKGILLAGNAADTFVAETAADQRLVAAVVVAGARERADGRAGNHRVRVGGHVGAHQFRQADRLAGARKPETARIAGARRAQADVRDAAPGIAGVVRLAGDAAFAVRVGTHVRTEAKAFLARGTAVRIGAVDAVERGQPDAVLA